MGNSLAKRIRGFIMARNVIHADNDLCSKKKEKRQKKGDKISNDKSTKGIPDTIINN